MPSRSVNKQNKLFILSKSLINRLTKINMVYVLGSLLVVASFLIGVLVTKVSYLENGVTTAATLGANTGGSNAGTVGQTGTAPSQGPVGPVDVGNGHFPILGNNDAKVTIVEFADFQCPFCEQFFTDIEANLKKDYIDTGKVRFAFRQYAFLGQESTDAANAAECANDQGKFWEYHDYLYQHQGAENSGAFSKDHLKEFAATLGLDTATFNDCLDTNKDKANVDKDLAEGGTAGVNGTPATFINGVLISGAVPYAQIKAEIDKQLAK